MIDREKLKYVIEALVDDDYNYPIACKVLEAMEKKAESLADYDTLGELSIMAKHYDLRLRAAKYAYTHCSSSEQLFKARENLYKVYNALNEPEQALFYIKLNLELKPNDVNTMTNYAANLSLMNRKEEAEDIISKIVPEDKKQARSLEHLMFTKQIREGKLADGIINFLTHDKPENPLFEKGLKLKYWDGIVQPGKTIVINTEGGVGDEIINIRFLNWFTERGMTPVLYSSWHMYRPDLAALFIRHGYEVYTVPYFFKKDWLWTHMMTLPGYMGLEEKDLWRGPYLTPLRQEHTRLNDTNFKIGIKCNGNPYFEQDIYRRIPIDQMISAMPKGVSVYFFDKELTDSRCINLKDKLDTWDDTLDYIDQMDVIVSSCTSLVHAAGAIGKRTIVLTPIAEYMLWISTKPDGSNPWYGNNFRVCKQERARHWEEPLAKVKTLVENYLQEWKQQC